MNIVCLSCSTRIGLDDAKVPAHAFSVRCPKCRNLINVQPPGNFKTSAPSDDQPVGSGANQDAPPAGGDAPHADHHPPGERPRFTSPQAAPLYKPANAAPGVTPGTSPEPPPAAAAEGAGELARALAALLQNAGLAKEGAALSPVPRKRRKVLVCVNNAHRDAVATPLAENGYEVYLAADALQALERMRQDMIDLLVMEPDFDAKGKGTVFVNRELTAMRPANRRQIFIVQLSASVRSADPHAAFINNVNLVVHPDDLPELPQILESVTRDYDELYRVFREAMAQAV
ncbi:MAG TPA: zinc-ribbon domain-containing protein [Pyrinomonadaceae bacterium]|jgi:predicted Zn finger-like uncharacterized protein|nr:zinc-ribbon domain-containing protein [Pyrinomonadaceae bacterium]